MNIEQKKVKNVRTGAVDVLIAKLLSWPDEIVFFLIFGQ